MKKDRLSSLSELYIHSLFALCLVFAMTVPMLLIGRDTLGEAVIALLYLLPVGWSASRWGQGPGLVAAITSALTFDYFFIPPFNTFAVGRLEGWLVLIIFLIVSIVVIGRIQSGLSRARASEREALFMYELSAALSGMYTQNAVVHTLARNLQQMFQAGLVEVAVQYGKRVSSLVVKIPSDHIETSKPDRILPILASPGLVGEIRLWRGNGWLPALDSRLLNNISNQAALAIERARLVDVEMHVSPAMDSSANSQ